MATNVILPALGAAQETGTILQWFKQPGDLVKQGEPLLEIETDKAAAEIEAPASGTLTNVTARVGDVVPVGQVIALVLAPGESAPGPTLPHAQTEPTVQTPAPVRERTIPATPVAARIAAENNVDLSLIKPIGTRVEKADVLAYIQAKQNESRPATALAPASPKARRIATERGIDLATIRGSGPDGAVIAADVPTMQQPSHPATELSSVWRVMAERTTASWTSVPHFFLMREVNVARLIAWREHLGKEVTFTDLLVKLVAAALLRHPRVNAMWNNDTVRLNDTINIGLAVATDEGLVVPVIANADTLKLSEIRDQRKKLVERAQANKLHLEDVRGGTFTISNLGMYGVDAFNAIINAPQAAILAVGRIAERVVPVNHQPSVQPMMVLSLSCDHRVIDGARGAQFLDTLAQLIEEPLALLD